MHNVRSDWSIHDPPLSKLGEEQCAELQESLKNSKIAQEVGLIVVSAMRRTLQTATLGLDFLINDKKPEVLPDAGVPLLLSLSAMILILMKLVAREF